jgi:hypothetical protein
MTNTTQDIDDWTDRINKIEKLICLAHRLESHDLVDNLMRIHSEIARQLREVNGLAKP